MKILYRLYQALLRIVSKILPWRVPTLYEGSGSLQKLELILNDLAIKKVFIVTDQGLVDTGLVNQLLKILQKNQVEYYVFDETESNPSIDTVLKAKVKYIDQQSEAIIAFGGGSPIDCAKVLGASIVRPNKSIEKMKGILKVRKKIPTLIAIPTTAGTGSEATLAAVISNPLTKEKYAINDHALIPHYAILDATLTLDLPPSLTAYTGMDALTHAVEAYIGRSNTKETIRWSEEAVKLIHESLLDAYHNPAQRNAREKMLKASYLAGLAFTRAYVGNIHAIAHTLGGFYRLPHGYTNAVILPCVLRYYKASVYKPLAKLARIINSDLTSSTDEAAATFFIEWIEGLNTTFSIPKTIPEIQPKDIPLMAKRAYHEANPLYPVPKILKKSEFIDLYYQLKA